MVKENMSKVQKLTVSAMVMALYVVVLYFTQSFSFGAYQIRIATALYALAYLFPFLVLPLGFANFIANFLFGGLGLLDWFGGCFVGIIVTAIIVLIRRKGWSRWLMILPIILVPGLGVSSYLSYLLHVPILRTRHQPVHRSVRTCGLRCRSGERTAACTVSQGN